MPWNKGEMDDSIIEQQNQHMSEELRSKVSLLKSLAIDIESETKQHNRLLDSLGGDFDSSTSLLGGTFGRMKKMVLIGKNNRQLTCYVSMFISAFLFVAYYLVSTGVK